MLPGSVAADGHTKPQHMAKVQIHEDSVNKNEWAISSVHLLHLPCAATTAKCLATNPKSPQVHGPPGMPRNSKPFSADGSAPLLVPKDEDHIRGSTAGCTTERGEKIPCTQREYKRNINSKYCLFSSLMFVDHHVTNQVK